MKYSPYRECMVIPHAHSLSRVSIPLGQRVPTHISAFMSVFGVSTCDVFMCTYVRLCVRQRTILCTYDFECTILLAALKYGCWHSYSYCVTITGEE